MKIQLIRLLSNCIILQRHIKVEGNSSLLIKPMIELQENRILKVFWGSNQIFKFRFMIKIIKVKVHYSWHRSNQKINQTHHRYFSNNNNSILNWLAKIINLDNKIMRISNCKTKCKKIRNRFIKSNFRWKSSVWILNR